MIKKGLLILLCLPMIGFGQQTYVPDDVFEAYLEAHGLGNGIPNDDSVLTNGLNLAQTLQLVPGVLSATISDVTGIEDFKSLIHLNIESQHISELNLSQTKFNSYLPGVPSITIEDNQLLNKIILPNDTVGTCGISSNYFLNELIFSDSIFFNGLMSITNNNMLQSCDLSVINGVGTQADLSIFENDNLELLNLANGFCNNWGGGFGVNIISNPILFCIQVDNPNYSEVVWSWTELVIDPLLYSYSTNCGWPTAIQEHTTSKELLKVTDILGRETKETNQPLLYIYDNGTVEKRIVIE